MDKKTLELFGTEVKNGLLPPQKSLSSKWFYDEIGDKLFIDIMNMPEYYLTNCEFEILSKQTPEVISAFGISKEPFDLYELGAGDGTKTMELLKSLQGYDFTYRPIDISIHAIDSLTQRVTRDLPNIKVECAQGEYFEVLGSLNQSKPKIILFMGSNIGNMLDERANAFLKALSMTMNAGDKLLLGVDLKKASAIVLPAYNDKQGITAKFNLNLLHRINCELDGNFDLIAFEHAPLYDEERGWAMSFIKSKSTQQVHIKALDTLVDFDEGETIFMEVSRKYDDMSIANITQDTGLQIVEKFYDSKNYFCDIVFEKQ